MLIHKNEKRGASSMQIEGLENKRGEKYFYYNF